MAHRTRIEEDALGRVRLPASARWGAEAERARRVFARLPLAHDPALVRAIADIKVAAARVHARLGHLPADVAHAIEAAALAGRSDGFRRALVVPVYAAGAGTSLHMNLNEAIALGASELLAGTGHPIRVDAHDHVNLHQSTNDVIPTAIRLACLDHLDRLQGALAGCVTTLRTRAAAVGGVMKAGRTHLQEAVPMRVADEVACWASTLSDAGQALRAAAEGMLEVPLGGAAIGTGWGCDPAYRTEVVAELARHVDRPALRTAPDPVAAVRGTGAFLGLGGAVRRLAGDLGVLASDLRLLASGSTSGPSEWELPVVVPGSSHMPGKINPSVAEWVNQIVCHVMGADAAVSAACAMGQLQLNAMLPVIAYHLPLELELLTIALRGLDRHLLAGMRLKAERCQVGAGSTLGQAILLGEKMGHVRVARWIREGATLEPVPSSPSATGEASPPGEGADAGG